MHRLFFALWAPEAQRGHIARVARDAVRDLPGARATSPTRYHLTLHFLGAFASRPDDLERAACDAVETVHAAPFDLVLDHLGGFPGARVWWLGCSDPPAGITRLHADLGHALSSSGIAADRHERFTPHLTIARGLSRMPPATAVEPIGWRVDSFALLRSSPGEGYVEVARWALGPPMRVNPEG